ncbi:metallophosphoesterase family protein [Haloplanus halobius]|uniref:metallophosphoesterase family protein n=1 Tax=Haloplanus halobius TaxID=2934938 RepID=UPI00200C9A63|nr:exonuclease SbcCD subunit D [Haloplanus sp. XH21]
MTQSNQDPRFVHLSDAHIGHRQYGVKKRRDDMYMTFRSAILDAIDEGVDFAVFSGDLFHNKDVNARALSDAENGLEEFDEAGIPVVGIQGNHDANLYKEDLNWLEYLHSRERLILLEANLQDEGPVFEKHDFEEPGTSSGYVDLNGVRVFGLQYLGQRTSDYLEEVAEAIKRVNEEEGEPEMTVLLGHFGVEDHIPGVAGGISFNQLEPLEEVVDYLGLGHLHKRYSHGDWVFNPGSLEAHDTREAQWEHGYYIVDVDSDGFEYEFNESKRRPFYRFSDDVFVDDYNTPQEFKEGFKQKLEEELPKLRGKQQKEYYKAGGSVRDPVIDLRLKGLLQFNRSQLDIDWVRDLVEEQTDALYVNLTDATESKEIADIEQELDGDIRGEDEQIDRGKLEAAVFQKLAGQDSRFRDREEEVAETLSVVKRSVLEDESPESVAETVKNRRRELFPDMGGGDE